MIALASAQLSVGASDEPYMVTRTLFYNNLCNCSYRVWRVVSRHAANSVKSANRLGAVRCPRPQCHIPSAPSAPLCGVHSGIVCCNMGIFWGRRLYSGDGNCSRRVCTPCCYIGQLDDLNYRSRMPNDLPMS